MKIYDMKQDDGTIKKFILQGDQLVEVKEAEPVKRITVTVDEAREMLGMSRNGFMPLLHTGKIKAVKTGKQWLIPIISIHEFLGIHA